jgi:quinone-modifying oxidoreductase subunit QmoC
MTLETITRPPAEPVPQKGDIRKVTRRVKYESELDLKFGEQVAADAYGENLLSCIQCGTCSATCPLSYYMDYSPRRVIAMVRDGFKQEAINSFTIWLCASCYACTVQCPRQIHITDVMYTLKRQAIQQGVYPKRYPVPVLARNFFSLVRRFGRSSEWLLLVRLYLQTNPFSMFGKAGLGMKLFGTGRMPLKVERIRDREKLRNLLRAGEPGGKEVG